ncbi:TSCPD domain-containing protein [Planctomycetales bacterium]|nr:TSCPD domain-containing protein [Planctomycetales bacterium]GHT09423.1 TSCPD domain-containing protein [Planctomycetales bacterium]GHV24213.1 TSCPD domain-containing protein [Planctomycetales bacterium]
MRHTHQTNGTCSTAVSFALRDGKVCDVEFTGGCDGNLQAIGKLVEGLPAAEVIAKLRGVNCDGKGTSCGDQLAQALAKATRQ